MYACTPSTLVAGCCSLSLQLTSRKVSGSKMRSAIVTNSELLQLFVRCLQACGDTYILYHSRRPYSDVMFTRERAEEGRDREDASFAG